MPGSAQAGAAPSYDCLSQGGTAVAYGWLNAYKNDYAGTGSHVQLSYLSVDDQTLWVCARFRNGSSYSTTDAAGVRLTVRGPAAGSGPLLPSVDDVVSACDGGTVLADGVVGPDNLPYHLAYDATDPTDVSVCLTAAMVRVRLHVLVDPGTPPDTGVVVVDRDAYPTGMNDGITSSPPPGPSGGCNPYFFDADIHVLGQQYYVGHDSTFGGWSICLRAGNVGGRLELLTGQQLAVWGAEPRLDRTYFDRCDVNLFTSTTPLRASVKMSSQPDPEWGLWNVHHLCVDNDVQPVDVSFGMPTVDPGGVPQVIFTPDS